MPETMKQKNRRGKSPLVSVIIPAYNHEKFILDSVRSVLEQDEQDFEIIIIDDGSTDGTGKILEKLEDERIHIVRQRNSGTASAINRGLSLATGSYISILNSDDLYHRDRLSTLVSEMEGSPEQLFAISRVCLIDGDGRPVQSGAEFEWLANAYRYYEETHDFLSSILKDNFTCTSSNFLFRRSLPEKIGNFNELRYVNDLDFMLRAITRCEYVYCDRELLDYRIHSANTMKEREREHRADFIFEFSWVIANLLDDREAYSRFNIPEMFNILHDVYNLHLESILFCWSYFRKPDCDKRAIIENEGIKNQIKGFINENLEREKYIRDLQASSDQAWEENRSLFGLIKERDNLIKKRDGEIVGLRETADELWKAREWFSDRLDEVLASRRYRLASALIDIIKFRNIRYNVKEILRAALGYSGVQKMREIRQHAPVKGIRVLLSGFRERVRRRLTRPQKFTQACHEGPLVSVIIPCYNYGGYLDRLIACLEEQTFRNFEIILIDDGSTDGNTIDKIAEIEKRGIDNLRIIRQDNQGVIAARNNAIEEAKGKYIFPLDADDTIERTFLQKCMLYLESFPPHCFVYSWTYSTGDSDFVWKTYDSDPTGCLNENRMGLMVFPREQFCQVGGYNPVMKDGYEDWELCVHLIRNGCVGRVIPEPLYNYFVKAEARNWFAVKKHELLKKTINDLHGDYIHKNRKMLRKIARKRHVAVNPLKNLDCASPARDKNYLMIDLRGKKFSPPSVFSHILTLADSTDRNIIVTLDSRWRDFFDLNGRSNLHVYCPENYHPEGDVQITYDYLRKRYRPVSLDMKDLEEMTASSIRVPDNKKNILYIAPWLIVGGADTMTIDWFRNLSDAKFNKYFMTTLPKTNTWIYKLKGHAREIYDLPSLGCVDARDIERFLVKFIRDKNIDIVHIMNSEMAFKALPAIKSAHPDVSVVAQFHCFDYLKDGTRVGYASDVPMKYDRHIDFYNVESYSIKDEILERFPYIDGDKFRIIYCCLDTKEFLPEDFKANPDIMKHRDDDKLNILFIGRLDRQKQPLLMARIARGLKERGFSFVVHVIGDGSLESQRGELERYIGRHNLSENIRLYGNQPLETLVDWYRTSDMLLMTSAWEGIPVVLYQAMFMGLVCVAPDVGGVGELLNDQNGCLIRDRDDIDSYISAIMEIGGDTVLRERLGGAARDLIAGRFDISVMRRGYEELYKGMIEK